MAVSGLATAQRSCGSMDYLEQQILNNPAREQQLQKIERFTEQYDPVAHKELNGSILTIPVIVHVVYATSAQNISDAQIASQIAVLNEDFRRLNADRSNTPADFRGVAADSEIEFCLTQVNRVATAKTSFSYQADDVKSSRTGGVDPVTPLQAMNIWVCEIAGNTLGYAQFPGGPAATDGVVIDYSYFGTTGTARAPFDLGRTSTHEVGHWLNLRHIWGDGGCNVDDAVADTPTAGGPNYTGGNCVYPGPNSCRSKGADLPDMFQNYMDYSDDACMNLFTTGQKDRMRAAVSAARPELISSSCDGTVAPPTDPEPPTADACPAPTGLNTATSNRGRDATFSWNSVQAANSYTIELYQNGALYASGTIGGTGASIGGLTRSATYTWRVRANCANNATSDWANTSFRARRETFTLNEALNVFPNPSAAATVTVAWDLQALSANVPAGTFSEEAPVTRASTVTIELHDMTGRLLRKVSVEDVGQAPLDVADLATGVYLVRVSDTDGLTATSRFVKR